MFSRAHGVYSIPDSETAAIVAPPNTGQHPPALHTDHTELFSNGRPPLRSASRRPSGSSSSSWLARKYPTRLPDGPSFPPAVYQATPSPGQLQAMGTSGTSDSRRLGTFLSRLFMFYGFIHARVASRSCTRPTAARASTCSFAPTVVTLRGTLKTRRKHTLDGPLLRIPLVQGTSRRSWTSCGATPIPRSGSLSWRTSGGCYRRIFSPLLCLHQFLHFYFLSTFSRQMLAAEMFPLVPHPFLLSIEVRRSYSSRSLTRPVLLEGLPNGVTSTFREKSPFLCCPRAVTPRLRGRRIRKTHSEPGCAN